MSGKIAIVLRKTKRRKGMRYRYMVLHPRKGWKLAHGMKKILGGNLT